MEKTGQFGERRSACSASRAVARPPSRLFGLIQRPGENSRMPVNSRARTLTERSSFDEMEASGVAPIHEPSHARVRFSIFRHELSRRMIGAAAEPVR